MPVLVKWISSKRKNYLRRMRKHLLASVNRLRVKVLALLLLLPGIVLPAFAAKSITVEQLEQVLAAAHGKPDAKVAQQLSGLQLTERLSMAKLARATAALPGPQSRRSLVMLADVSAFLDPPAAEIPATAAPDFATQRRMIALTVDYASKTIHQLPNFFATRDTVRFEDSPQGVHADTSEIHTSLCTQWAAPPTQYFIATATR